jgi:hypothetical protein
MDQHARTLFSIAAAFNVAVALPFLVAAPSLARLIGLQPVPSDPLFVHLVAVLVLTFGWGYWRVSRDPITHRSIIHLGVVGKLLVVLAGYVDWLVGNTNGRFVLLVTGDAVFVVLFLDYLRRHPIQAT